MRAGPRMASTGSRYDKLGDDGYGLGTGTSGTAAYPPSASPYARDPESGLLYPEISPLENLLRLGFIRKVLGILSAQLLLSACVAGFIVNNAPAQAFVRGSLAFTLCVGLILPLVLLPVLYCYRQSHPLNLGLLAAFTASMSISLGMACAAVPTLVLFEAVALTALVVFGLFSYTFYAARKGQDFGYLGPFLFVGLLSLLGWSFIQFFFPMGPIAHFIFALVGALLFGAYIVYDVNNLIRMYSLDDYVWASVALYLDIINLFLEILKIVSYLNRDR